MNNSLIEAYKYLVPTDQKLIDALIYTLATKDKQNEKLCDQVKKFLEENE
jgi:hypothetical protein